MRRLAALALIAGLSLGSSGCGVVNNLLNRGEDVVDDTLSTGEIATDAPAEEPSAEEFKDPLLPGLPSAAEIASAELIRPTNAEERIKGIEGSRSDPYALVPVPPAPTPTSSPGVPSGSNSGGTSGGGTSGGGTTGTTPGNTIPLNELPSLPQPTTAVGVVVTGIVQINGDRYAIINAPGEPTSRYVKAGDYIAGGRILVKRIETRPGSEPVVILEENGIEVAMPVGGTTSPTEEPPAAALPNSSTTTAALPQLTLGLSPL
ncbi:MAG: hypothetical protein O3A14_11445 [Cyanobacteria bacterium]|nr:hypothetical protein [Cyanobacteriota bacterium]